MHYCTRCKASYHACPVGVVKIIKEKYIKLEERLKIPANNVELMEKRCKMTLKDILLSKPHEIHSINKNY